MKRIALFSPGAPAERSRYTRNLSLGARFRLDTMGELYRRSERARRARDEAKKSSRIRAMVGL